MKLHSNRWNWRDSGERGVVGDGDRVLWGLRGLHGRSQLESPKHGRFDLHRLQHLDYLIVAGQAASAAGNVAGSVRDGVASVCQVTERYARHIYFPTSAHSHLREFKSKDWADCISCLCPQQRQRLCGNTCCKSHQWFQTLFRMLRERQVSDFCPTSMPPQSICHTFREFISWRRQFWCLAHQVRGQQKYE